MQTFSYSEIHHWNKCSKIVFSYLPMPIISKWTNIFWLISLADILAYHYGYASYIMLTFMLLSLDWLICPQFVCQHKLDFSFPTFNLDSWHIAFLSLHGCQKHISSAHLHIISIRFSSLPSDQDTCKPIWVFALIVHVTFLSQPVTNTLRDCKFSQEFINTTVTTLNTSWTERF